jgi:co-chaperonin GroES (HSP10)
MTMTILGGEVFGFAEQQPQPEPAFENEAEDIPAKLPRILFYRLLVMPVKPKRMTSGGILLPDASLEAQELFNPYGRLVYAGEACFRSKNLSVDGSPLQVKPNVGDWVWYGRGAGAKIQYAGRKFLILNDDELLGIIDDIDEVRRSL